jgi:GNAT superfamily N-acetyltransferase
VPRIKKEAEETENLVNGIRSYTDKNGTFPNKPLQLPDIDATMVSIFPIDLSFLKKVNGAIKIPHNIDVNLENLEYCKGIEAKISKNVKLKNLEHVDGLIYLGKVQILDLPNLITCSGRIQADQAEIVNMPKLIRAHDLKFYSAKKIDFPNLIEVSVGGMFKEYKGTILSKASEIILPKLKKCTEIGSSSEVTKLVIPNLESIQILNISDLKIDSISIPCTEVYELDLGRCIRVNLPNLEKIERLRAVYAKEVNIPKLKYCKDLYLDSLEFVNLPQLEYVTQSASFAKAKKINLKNLIEIGSLHTEEAEEINVNSLKTIANDSSFFIPRLKRLYLMSLEKLGDGIYIQNAANLKILSLPKLTHMSSKNQGQELINYVREFVSQNLKKLTLTWSFWDQLERLNISLLNFIDDKVKNNNLELNIIFNGKIEKYKPTINNESFKDYLNCIEENLDLSQPNAGGMLPEGPQTVTENGKEIGELEFDFAPNIDKKELLSYFTQYDDNMDSVARYIQSLPLPKRFNYVWIQLIKVSPRMRGKGKGTQILQAVFNKYKKNTVFALSVNEIASGKSTIENNIKFYQSNGFQIVKNGKEVYGFRINR